LNIFIIENFSALERFKKTLKTLVFPYPVVKPKINTPLFKISKEVINI
jgi:hypothetical protein